MAWIESHQELRDHPKRRRLSRLLEISRRETIGLLHELWWWAYDYAAEGDLAAFTDADIADAIDWDSDPGALVAALVEAGFLTADRQIHDWADFAQKWIERRQADRERKRAARSKPPDVLEMSTGRPAEIPSLSGVTGPNRTGPNLTVPDTLPPTPSPHGGEGVHHTNGVAKDAIDQDGGVPRVLTADDKHLWERSRERLRSALSAANWALLVEPLEPLGRSAGGGLCLRAPPDLGIAGRIATAAKRALVDEGEPAERAKALTIVEAV